MGLPRIGTAYNSAIFNIVHALYYISCILLYTNNKRYPDGNTITDTFDPAIKLTA